MTKIIRDSRILTKHLEMFLSSLVDAPQSYFYLYWSSETLQIASMQLHFQKMEWNEKKTQSNAIVHNVMTPIPRIVNKICVIIVFYASCCVHAVLHLFITSLFWFVSGNACVCANARIRIIARSLDRTNHK